ncbi:MAG: PH domain-containing protein [Planctomycetes bacterium]|nr:PH domain-containing protein [Planctomycetota bacterium]
MKCLVCGGQLDEEARFCHLCGKPIEAGAASKDPAKQKFVADRPAAETLADRIRGGISPADDPEEDFWEGGYSAKAMIGSWIGAAAISIALVVGVAMFASDEKIVGTIVLIAIGAMWGFLLLRFLYRKLSVQYELTSQRFIHKSGILTRTTDRIELIDIDDVSFRQGLIERFVGVGTITILSSDSSHPELLLRGIENVKVIAETIDDARRLERRRRGLHIEAI